MKMIRQRRVHLRLLPLLLLCAILTSGCGQQTHTSLLPSVDFSPIFSSPDPSKSAQGGAQSAVTSPFPSPPAHSFPAHTPSPSDPLSSSLPLSPSFKPSVDPSSPSVSEDEERPIGRYLGTVYEGGTGKDGLTYLFLIDGKQTPFLLQEEDGYPLQNELKIGYSYLLTVVDGMIVDLVEEEQAMSTPVLPPVSVTPGKRTLKNLLSTALLPMGNALYVYGGGWNWQDNGASIQASSIGVSPYWTTFFEQQDTTYSYKEPNGKDGILYYPQNGINNYYYAGLDCSGYLGWVVYNTLYSESGQDGFVVASTKFAQSLANKGYGVTSSSFEELSPGDIVSVKGHVWLCIGRCADGSIVIAHSTHSLSRAGYPGGGVQLSAIGKDKGCEAYLLADHYMKTHFPRWYERYGTILCAPAKYTDLSAEGAARFSFSLSDNGLDDPEGISALGAQEILAMLFED